MKIKLLSLENNRTNLKLCVPSEILCGGHRGWAKILKDESLIRLEERPWIRL